MLFNPKIGQIAQICYAEKKWPVHPPLQHKYGTIVLTVKNRPRSHLLKVDGVQYVIPAGHVFMADVVMPKPRQIITKKRKKLVEFTGMAEMNTIS